MARIKLPEADSLQSRSRDAPEAPPQKDGRKRHLNLSNEISALTTALRSCKRAALPAPPPNSRSLNPLGRPGMTRAIPLAPDPDKATGSQDPLNFPASGTNTAQTVTATGVTSAKVNIAHTIENPDMASAHPREQDKRPVPKPYAQRPPRPATGRQRRSSPCGELVTRDMTAPDHMANHNSSTLTVTGIPEETAAITVTARNPNSNNIKYPQKADLGKAPDPVETADQYPNPARMATADNATLIPDTPEQIDQLQDSMNRLLNEHGRHNHLSDFPDPTKGSE